VSQDPSDSIAGREIPPPAHPLDDLWYLHGDSGTLGPYKGSALKAMIDAGSVAADAMVARVGASQWSAIGDVPMFASSAGKRGPVKYAGFWMRLFAYIIDVLIVYVMIFVVGSIVGFVIGYAAGASDPPPDDMVLRIAGVFFAVAVVCCLFYYIYFPSGKWQATPGKRICGIHIICVDGGRVTGLVALGRYLSYIVSTLPLGIGFLMIGWSEEKKGLHDMMCATRVIYGRL
jgi:uncharacterized RDD family membrane protein YckC